MESAREVVIVSALRTPFSRFGGVLRDFHSTDLGAIVIKEVLERAGLPGEKVDIKIKTDGGARVGIVAVDKSVFILAENRLNLQQVFDELERLYMEPQAELHEISLYPAVATKGEGVIETLSQIVDLVVAGAQERL